MRVAEQYFWCVGVRGERRVYEKMGVGELECLVIDRRNRICDRRKAWLNGHHDRQYVDITTTFTNFKSFITFSDRIFAMF